MNEIQIFNHAEFGEVRTLAENGTVLFCGGDVAIALGYQNPSRDVQRHCKSIVSRCTTDSVGRQQEMLFIPEPDLYRLVFRSKLPSAERFTDWVTEEVLPSIRKHGGYLAGQEEMSDAELMAKALMVADRKIKERDYQIQHLTEQAEEMRPKALFADSVAAAGTSILIGELAKILRQNGADMGEKRLFDWMRTEGYLIKRKGTDYNMPTQKSMELGLFRIKETVINHSNGHTTVSKTVKVTGKGQQYFVNKFLADYAD